MGTDGFVQIADRIKDVIKTGGEWVSSIEVESLVTQVPGVLSGGSKKAGQPRTRLPFFIASTGLKAGY